MSPREFLPVAWGFQLFLCFILAMGSISAGNSASGCHYIAAGVAYLYGRFGRSRVAAPVAALCLVIGMLLFASRGGAVPLWSAVPLAGSAILFALLSLQPLPAPEPSWRVRRRPSRSGPV